MWAIIFILFFLDLTFAVNQYYQQMVRVVLFFFSHVRTAAPNSCAAARIEFEFVCVFIIRFPSHSYFSFCCAVQEKGKWADYLHGEYVFCVLSLVAKQLLAWLNFGGAKALR